SAAVHQSLRKLRTDMTLGTPRLSEAATTLVAAPTATRRPAGGTASAPFTKQDEIELISFRGYEKPQTFIPAARQRCVTDDRQVQLNARRASRPAESCSSPARVTATNR